MLIEIPSHTNRSRTPIVLVAVLVLVLLAGLSASAARAGEVHFDPQSPAEKEYALPLQQARNEALGGGGESSARPEAAPLFGVGVGGDPAGGEPEASRPSRSGSNRSGHRSESGTKPASPGHRADGPGTAEGTARRFFTVPADSYPIGQGLLILAGLLLAGLAVGAGLRARGRRLST